MQMTKEEVLQVVTYCQKHGVTYKSYLADHGMSEWRFYESKRKYLAEEEQSGKRGEFLQLVPGGPAVPSSIGFYESRKRRREPSSAAQEDLMLEIQSPSGKVLRLHGSLSSDQLRELVKSL